MKDYFSELQNLLRRSAFIENVDVEYEVKSKTVGLIHGTVGMVDGSTLQFMELVNIKRDKITRPKYRFHFMDSADKMVFRFDNLKWKMKKRGKQKNGMNLSTNSLPTDFAWNGSEPIILMEKQAVLSGLSG